MGEMFVASDFKVAWLWAHIELFVRACLNSSCSYTGGIFHASTVLEI